MQISNDIQNKFSFFAALSLSFFLASCGSYQYVGYDSDGIYNSNSKTVVYEEAKTIPVEDQSIYKDYFTQKTLQYSEIPNDSTAIFTDIDSYEGNYTTDVIDGVQYGQTGWGESNANVTINVYDNSWYQPWGWYAGFGWNNWRYNNWGWYGPWGYNNWGWNAGFGYNGLGWNTGFGFGYAWNHWGYNNFWCPPYYRNNYYRGNNYAYNYGRRGDSHYRNVNYGRRNVTRNSSSQIRRRSSLQTRTTSSSIRPRRTISNTRTRNANSTVRTRSQSPRNSNTSVRPRSNSSRNSNSSARSSRSRSSSSSARSSRSSSSRSSGSSRSSSRGGSGRRG